MFCSLKHSEENITVDCQIRTMDVGDFSEISLSDECNLNKVVLNAIPLAEILQDLDNASDELELLLSPEPPYIKITTNSIMVITLFSWNSKGCILYFQGECVVDISRHSEIVTLFQCKQTTVSKYAFSFIRQILKVLSYASKVSVSTGESELLGLQLFINHDEKQMYVEYYITAQYGEEWTENCLICKLYLYYLFSLLRQKDAWDKHTKYKCDVIYFLSKAYLYLPQNQIWPTSSNVKFANAAPTSSVSEHLSNLIRCEETNALSLKAKTYSIKYTLKCNSLRHSFTHLNSVEENGTNIENAEW